MPDPLKRPRLRHLPWLILGWSAVALGFAGVLFVGLWRGTAMLRYLLQSAFEGLTDEGWLKLSRNWACAIRRSW